MKITRRQLRQIIQETIKHSIKESSREGHWYDAGYEDGSDGSDPKYMNNMAYMDGYETGLEDYEFDKKRLRDADNDGIADFADTDKNNDGQVDDPHNDMHTRIGETYLKEQQMPDSWARILGNCLGDKN